METHSVQSILGQIRALQDVIHQRAPVAATPENKDAAFSSVLRSSLERVNQSQARADQLTRSFELGEPGVQLQDVMISMQKANLSFQTMVQVRNRVVAAYQDIMNMPV